jgi:hypothetical protein
MTRRPVPSAVAGALALAVVVVTALVGAAPAGAEDDVGFTARIDGREVADAGSNDAVEIDPAAVTDVELTITNDGADDVVVRRVRLFGEAVGLTLVAYDVTLDLPVPAGATETIDVPVEFIDLERQATGLLPGGLALYDEDREQLAVERFVIDVQGDLTSVLGLFGIFVGVATALGIVGIVLGVSRRTLGPNRLRRALRFGFVGLGVGLTGVISLAVFRIVAPSGAVWVPMLLVPTLVGAVLGYVSPGPLAIEEPDEVDDALAAAQASQSTS